MLLSSWVAQFWLCLSWTLEEDALTGTWRLWLGMPCPGPPACPTSVGAGFQWGTSPLWGSQGLGLGWRSRGTWVSTPALSIEELGVLRNAAFSFSFIRLRLCHKEKNWSLQCIYSIQFIRESYNLEHGLGLCKAFHHRLLSHLMCCVSALSSWPIHPNAGHPLPVQSCSFPSIQLSVLLHKAFLSSLA